MTRHLLILLFLAISSLSIAQNISITTAQDVLYARIDNSLKVSVDNIPCSSLVLKADKGEIYRNECQFTFYSGYFGKVLITIYKQANDELVKLGESVFIVKQLPKPIIKIGIGMSRMPLVEFRNQDYARIEMIDFSEIKYKLQKFTVTVLYKESNTFNTITNTGSKFSDSTKKMFSALKPNDIIILDGILALDPNGKDVDIEPRMLGVY